MRDKENFIKAMARVVGRFGAMPQRYADAVLADVAEEAVTRALVETLEARVAEIPFQAEDVSERVQTSELVEYQFDLVSPPLVRMLGQLPKRDEVYRFRFRVLPWEIFLPTAEGEDPLEDLEVDAMDRRLEEHGMRRPTLEEAAVAMVMVSHRFGDFLTTGYLDDDLPVCALIRDSEKRLEMRRVSSRLVLEISDTADGLPSNYCYIGVLVEEKKS